MRVFDDPPLVLLRRLVQLVVGLCCFGFAIALIVRGALGVSPWDVLTQGIALHTGMSFGLITVLMSGLVLLMWIPLRQRPGFGTVLNAVTIGPVADLGLHLIPTGLDLWVRVCLLIGGILLTAIASGLYIGAWFGPGPRDGLMTGLHLRFGWPLWVGRTIVEVTVLAIGWVLGGNVGIGTLAFALGIGPLCGVAMRWLAVWPSRHAMRRASAVDASAEAGSVA
ncbi:MAG TPA: hypothetical protein VFU07_08000 [Candidatus Lumbricidophila sp.]|nr:hypothetical protein [Candidatus Lumbricidophila sp.]